MKKIIILSFLLSFLWANSLKSQIINFSFSANYSCEPISLDSIIIKNISRNCDTTLYYPDTLIVFNFNNIDGYNLNSNNVYLFQNYPNPFETKTNFEIFVPRKDNYIINIYDLSGKAIASYNKLLIPGLHSFKFYAGIEDYYLLSVKTSDFFDIKKLSSIRNKNYTIPYITHSGITSYKKSFAEKSFEKTKKSYFSYFVGDELKFKGFIEDDYISITDNPSVSNNYVFNFEHIIPESPIELPHIVYETKIIWNWSSSISAKGYKYNLINKNYNDAKDNGFKTSYIQDNLGCETNYTIYVWAYNNCGHSPMLTLEEKTGECTWTCGEKLFYKGSYYSTLKIANQCWFAENLNVGTMIYGYQEQGACCDNIKKYCYGNLYFNCQKYGGLYQWNQLMCGEITEISQGICPPGWHIPTDDDWKTLEINLGMTQLSSNSTGWRGFNEGSKMSGTYYLWENGNLKNNTGFGTSGINAIPAGFINQNGSFLGESYTARFWSSSQENETPWYRRLEYTNTNIYRNTENKNNGFSIRCVRNI